MRSPYAPFDPRAVTPVAGAARTPAREGTAGGRSFAELLAEAEAVQDHIEIRRTLGHAGPAGTLRGAVGTAVRGAVQGAAGLLAHPGPWQGLPLLRRLGPHRKG